MYGPALERSPAGQLGAGPGLAASTGRISLIPPTTHIERTGQEETVDGVRFAFQLGPGPPPGLIFLLPDRRALCLAENAAHSQHDLLDLRGAHVRDPRRGRAAWPRPVALFAGRADVAFASHHWPTWGAENIDRLLSQQRDLYAYLHDQTLRLMSKGLTGAEIAEHMQLPPALDQVWHTHGYHGSTGHNVKAIYQHYLGWYDGNPAHLWEHPPRQSALRYVECLGGGAAVVALAKGYLAENDLRFAAQLLNHAVFADEGNKEARDLLAEVYTRLGHGAENAAWRNSYLMGALELDDGIVPRQRRDRVAGPGRRAEREPDLRHDRHPRSTGPGPGTRACRSTGTSPTWGERYPYDAVQRRAHPAGRPAAAAGRPDASADQGPAPRPDHGQGSGRSRSGGRHAACSTPGGRAGRPRTRLRDRDPVTGPAHITVAATACAAGPATSAAETPPACQLAAAALTQVSTATPNIAAHSGSTYRAASKIGNASQVNSGESALRTVQSSVTTTSQARSRARPLSRPVKAGPAA